jgi:hypothetical protein
MTMRRDTTHAGSSRMERRTRLGNLLGHHSTAAVSQHLPVCGCAPMNSLAGLRR